MATLFLPVPHTAAIAVSRQEYVRPTVTHIGTEAAQRAPVYPFGPAREVAQPGTLADARYTARAVRTSFDGTVLREVAEGRSGRFAIPIAEGESLTAAISQVRHRGSKTYTLIGTLEGYDPSEVLLVSHQGILSGYATLFAERRHYLIAMPDGRDTVIRLADEDALTAACGVQDAGGLVEEPSVPGSPKAGSALSSTPGLSAPTAGDTIMDVVVGYGSGARSDEGGTAQMEAKIVASVDRMNACFIYSRITGVELVLLGTIEDPDYAYPGSESGGMGDELMDLNFHGDGKLDAVSQLRMDLGADLNTFVIREADGQHAGLAYLSGRSAIVARPYMTSSRLIFAHELGHNIGCRHAWGDTDCDTSGRNYGWRMQASPTRLFRTVMAYDHDWARIPYFSNPEVLASGVKAGAVDGYDATNDETVDPRLVSGGLDGACSTGYDGSHAGLGADNARYIMDRARYVEDNAMRTWLTVTAPAGGLTLNAGQSHTITWVGGVFGDMVDIDVHRGDVFVCALASSVANNARSYSWTVPAGLPGAGDYRIRVQIQGGATAFSPAFTIRSAILEASPDELHPACVQGQDATSDSFQIWNGGVDSMGYTLTAAEPWLSVAPSAGSSTGEHDVIEVAYHTASLVPGRHEGSILIEAPGASHAPRAIPVHLDITPAWALQVISAHGVATPPAGIHTNADASVLTNSVSSPVVQGTTRYLCTGWAMSGNEPGTGSTPTMIMTHTNNAVLRWQWDTNFWLDTEVIGDGTVHPSDAWRERGEEVCLEAVPGALSYFDGWSGTGVGMITSGDIGSTNITVTMHDAAQLTAVFNAHSLVIDSIAISNQSAFIRWATLPEFSYGVERADSSAAAYDAVADYVAATPPSNTYSDAAIPASAAVYRVRMSSWTAPDGMEAVSEGTFQMGDSMGDDTGSSEQPVHAVTLGTFFVEPHEVTKALWDEVYSWAATNGYDFENTGSGKGPDHPVYMVNWYDCVKWCNARSEKEGLPPVYYRTPEQTAVYRTGQVDVVNEAVDWSARGYRLPTEAEWESAARSNNLGWRFPWGNTIEHASANYRSAGSYAYDVSATSGYHPTYYTGAYPYTSPVGRFAPNDGGLYDAAGNVWEFCWDWYGSYSAGPVTNPVGPATGDYRVVRGGSFNLDANRARCSKRLYMSPRYAYYDGGFRCVVGF